MSNPAQVTLGETSRPGAQSPGNVLDLLAIPVSCALAVMAIAQPYIPAVRVPLPSRGKAVLALNQYFRGTSVSSWFAFGALAAMFLVTIFAHVSPPSTRWCLLGSP